MKKIHFTIKNGMNKTHKLMLMMTLFFVIGIAYSAKADPDTPTEADSAPIDGGISLLVAAGVGYGVKKMKSKSDKE